MRVQVGKDLREMCQSRGGAEGVSPYGASIHMISSLVEGGALARADPSALCFSIY